MPPEVLHLFGAASQLCLSLGLVYFLGETNPKSATGYEHAGKLAMMAMASMGIMIGHRRRHGIGEDGRVRDCTCMPHFACNQCRDF